MDEKKLEKIDVSVVMTTWGHDQFIIQAIEGVLNQKFDGNIELIVTNDRSPDETDKIVTNYLRNTVIPENIHVKYILNEKNLGAVKNFLYTIGISRGEFIGVCEGDDYWIDPYKVQKQVDFLRENTDCNLAFHRVQVLNENGELTPEELNNSETSFKRDIHYLAEFGNFMHTPSVMFRNNLEFDERIFTDRIGDYVVWFISGQKGKFGYIPDVMSVYRLWNGSIWGLKSEYFRIQNSIRMLIRMIKYNEDDHINKLLVKQAHKLFLFVSLKEMNLKERLNYLKLTYEVSPSFTWKLLLKGFSHVKKGRMFINLIFMDQIIKWVSY